MHSRTLNRFVVLGLVLPILAVAVRAQVPVVCQTPQGNARLTLNGVSHVGSTVVLGLTGTPGAGYAFAAGFGSSAITLPWGSICLGNELFLLSQGLGLPATGQTSLPLTIPVVPNINGVTVYFQGAAEDRAASGGVAVSNVIPMTVKAPTPIQTIYYQNFEGNTSNWTTTSGLWQIGTPLATGPGPAASWSGSRCAGTNLKGNYGDNANSILKSWTIPTLPNVQTGERILLNYRVWFATEVGYDFFRMMVSTDGGQSFNPAPGAGSMSGSNGTWVQAQADLTSFAGKNIRLGLRFTSNGCCTRGAGAYVDDLHIFKGTPFFNAPEGFENGLGHWWHASQGLWEVGAPTSPCKPRSGTKCAAVMVKGNYPDRASTRLISAPLTLPTTPVTMFFYHCFATERSHDGGYVQISTDGGKTFTSVTDMFSGNSVGWTQASVDLQKYRGQTIIIAFYFTSNGCCTRGPGWLIDDIRIQ